MTSVVIANRFMRKLYPSIVFLLLFCILAWSAVGQSEKPVDFKISNLPALPVLMEPGGSSAAISCVDHEPKIKTAMRENMNNACRIDAVESVETEGGDTIEMSGQMSGRS